MIQINNITFSFSDTPLFNDFSISFNNNEIVSIIGNSGCGKSTLLNLITGLLRPSNGEILCEGDTSYLTQHITLLPYRNALENSLLACELRNINLLEKKKEAKSLFKLFRLGEQAERKFPYELSGGMKQRVGLIQTLLLNTHIFLLDEPFKEVDWVTSFVIQNYIWKFLKEQLKAGIIVTHDVEQAVLISDKILILSNNQIQEVIFDKDYSLSSPEERLKSILYNKYMLNIIDILNNLQ